MKQGVLWFALVACLFASCVVGDSHPCNGKVTCSEDLICVSGWCVPKSFAEFSNNKEATGDAGKGSERSVTEFSDGNGVDRGKFVENDKEAKPERNCTPECTVGARRSCYPSNTKGCDSNGENCTGACKGGSQFCFVELNCPRWSQCYKSVVPIAEDCNGKDDNCDGKIDESLSRSCYTGPAGTEGVGLCLSGSQTCESAKWSACKNEYKPVKEECDNLDNDCDGSIDEALTTSCYTGPAGTDGKGICKKGTQTCSAGKWSTCAGEVVPTTETCNGKDDNCDGAIDEKLTRTCFGGKASEKNVGICREGTETCSAGKWGTCVGQILPKTEGCDKLDNDCDGQTDEGCNCGPGAKQSCGKTDVGTCKKGSQTCNVAGKWGACTGEIGPKAEICNNADDDCDGQTDESLTRPCYTGKAGTDGKGICKKGTETCSAGKWGTCVGQVVPATESCDGRDNDCDGQTDEGLTRACYSGPNGTDGKGICKKGTETCSAGQWANCTGQVIPAAESCNNKDDDCDGQVDELLTKACYTGKTGTLGKGTCKGGKQACIGGTFSGACVGQVTPVTETCDTKDDDCDGRVDEGCVVDFAGTGVQGFKNGPIAQAQFRFNGIVPLAVDSKGNLYVGDNSNYRIRKIDKAGNVTTYAGSGGNGFQDGAALQAQFSELGGLAFDANDNLYVSDAGNRRIRKITPTGIVSTVAGDGMIGDRDGAGNQAQFGSSLQQLVMDASGNVFVADYTNKKIRKIAPNGVVSTVVKMSRANFPTGLTLIRGGLYFSAGNQIFSFIGNNLKAFAGDANPGFKDELDPKSSLFYGPGVLRFVSNFRGRSDGFLFMADVGNWRIRVVNLTSGRVSTLVGDGTNGVKNGPALQSWLGEANGLIVVGNTIYFADLDANRIRKVEFD